MVDTFRPIEDVEQVVGQRRAAPRRLLDGVGELRRMGGGEADDRPLGPARPGMECRRRGGGGRVRVDEEARLGVDTADLGQRRGVEAATDVSGRLTPR